MVLGSVHGAYCSRCLADGIPSLCNHKQAVGEPRCIPGFGEVSAATIPWLDVAMCFPTLDLPPPPLCPLPPSVCDSLLLHSGPQSPTACERLTRGIRILGTSPRRREGKFPGAPSMSPPSFREKS